MKTEIITLYVIFDQVLQDMNRADHPQSQMNDAELLTTALVATINCGGTYAQTRRWLNWPHSIPTC